MRKRISLSQNFIRNKYVVKNLVADSSITKDDTVIEIGAGQGTITQVLLSTAGKVIAYESDRNLYEKLKSRFEGLGNFEIKFADFLTSNLPFGTYKVFSNIPFNITSDVVRKLTVSDNPPEDSYLFMQREAASKFAGKPVSYKNSQTSILLFPFFNLSVVHFFDENDFFPRPNVQVVLLRILKRDKPFIEYRYKKYYEDFVVYAFNQFAKNLYEGLKSLFGEETLNKFSKFNKINLKVKPSDFTAENWISLFKLYQERVDTRKKRVIEGSFKRQIKKQSGIKKIHRTRNDKDWKNK